MSHTMKIWERIIEARLRDRLQLSKQQLWIYARKGNNRCHVCLNAFDSMIPNWGSEYVCNFESCKILFFSLNYFY